MINQHLLQESSRYLGIPVSLLEKMILNGFLCWKKCRPKAMRSAFSREWATYSKCTRPWRGIYIWASIATSRSRALIYWAIRFSHLPLGKSKRISGYSEAGKYQTRAVNNKWSNLRPKCSILGYLFNSYWIQPVDSSCEMNKSCRSVASLGLGTRGLTAVK